MMQAAVHLLRHLEIEILILGSWLPGASKNNFLKRCGTSQRLVLATIQDIFYISSFILIYWATLAGFTCTAQRLTLCSLLCGQCSLHLET